MKSIHVIVTGKVQGVFFRASTCDLAKKLNITGWVRNNRDGTVELEATGDEEKINVLIDWLHHGPKFAAVTQVTVSDIAPKTFNGFISTR